jgi:hypothetical protein
MTAHSDIAIGDDPCNRSLHFDANPRELGASKRQVPAPVGAAFAACGELTRYQAFGCGAARR